MANVEKPSTGRDGWHLRERSSKADARETWVDGRQLTASSTAGGCCSPTRGWLRMRYQVLDRKRQCYRVGPGTKPQSEWSS